MKRSSKKKAIRTGNVPCDICDKKRILEEHHIRGRKIPDHNHPSNLCYLCPNCHTDCHNDVLIIEDWVTTSSGKELMWHKQGDESFTGRQAKTYLVGGKNPKTSKGS
jgi:uncharacterized protein YlaI